MSETEGSGSDKIVKRADIIAALALKTSLPRGKALMALDAIQEAIAEALISGKEVRLPNFGTFVVSDRKAGKGRDPRTGTEIDIPASRSARFRPAKGLKDAMNAE